MLISERRLRIRSIVQFRDYLVQKEGATESDVVRYLQQTYKTQIVVTNDLYGIALHSEKYSALLPYPIHFSNLRYVLNKIEDYNNDPTVSR